MDEENENFFTCDRCSYQTKYKSSLKRHIIRIHEGNLQRNKKGFIYKCDEGGGCKYETTYRRHLSRHIESKHRRQKRMKKCDYCDFTSTSLPVLKKHERITHKGQALANHSCSLCKVSFDDKNDFQNHLDTAHKIDGQFHIVESAFQKNLRIYQRHMRKKAADSSCLWEVFEEFKALCQRLMAEEFPIFRFNLCLFGIFSKVTSSIQENETEVFALKSTHFIIKPHTKLKKIFSTIIKNLDERVENILLRGCK